MHAGRKNILLIAGTGRNVGKTLFACRLIETLDCKNKLVCIKVSPHFHNLNEELEIVLKTENFVITKENNKTGSKDSNRLYRAGSNKVYYVQSKDDFLTEILSYFEKILPPETPIICESGGLRDLIVPGLFLMINKKYNNNIKPRAIGYKKLADKWIEFNGENFNFAANKIVFTTNGWEIKN
ncbi:hypothetical protein BZG02_09800 [Labilibaculum filiforme]|uniref:Uncharacterized protein n=1 Tax=Labilibaculum filiforme TaxID=1940526 RepID=A0A2N3HYC5_9BACT|nr:hypothetical protein [Labilibaculum filiforme]PKQ63054.1 hypothetical protein BZG02_09800 [Labilibaculum filiforme]